MGHRDTGLCFVFFFFVAGGVKVLNSAQWHPTSEHQADLLMKGWDGGVNRDGVGSTSAEKVGVLSEFSDQQENHQTRLQSESGNPPVVNASLLVC